LAVRLRCLERSVDGDRAPRLKSSRNSRLCKRSTSCLRDLSCAELVPANSCCKRPTSSDILCHRRDTFCSSSRRDSSGQSVRRQRSSLGSSAHWSHARGRRGTRMSPPAATGGFKSSTATHVSAAVPARCALRPQHPHGDRDHRAARGTVESAGGRSFVCILPESRFYTATDSYPTGRRAGSGREGFGRARSSGQQAQAVRLDSRHGGSPKRSCTSSK
jgi:hypothetical protein